LTDENIRLDVIITRADGMVESDLPHRRGRIISQISFEVNGPVVTYIVNTPRVNSVRANHLVIPGPYPRDIRPVGNITPATEHTADAGAAGPADNSIDTSENTLILQMAMRVKHFFSREPV
jgi:hypothetical protein